MGVAVLNPGDCLKLPNPPKHPRNLRHNPNPNPSRTQSNRRKRSPNTSPPSRPTVGHAKAPSKNLVMGQVKILKRGEDLKESKPDNPTRLQNENADPDLCSTNCTAQVQPNDSKARSDKVLPASFYAGSAYITSPPPSSVPLPAFFTKKIVAALEDDVATSALRKILRLDL
ncbi:hypothetical protein V6N13_081353 [Hibiscus sabdariffa]|uniref:Uncharacterized protein n=1 Tax=Hibiscus sabdariffa TaxID=183260 RepID=A0ABR2DBY2_9ROSI